MPKDCIDTVLSFADKTMSVWNLGDRGHSCATNGGDCVNDGDNSPSGPIELSGSCDDFNCFDGAHISGDDITCETGVSEAECADRCGQG